MKRSIKIALFLALAIGGTAAEMNLCCGIPSCIPGTNCSVSK